MDATAENFRKLAVFNTTRLHARLRCGLPVFRVTVHGRQSFRCLASSTGAAQRAGKSVRLESIRKIGCCFREGKAVIAELIFVLRLVIAIVLKAVVRLRFLDLVHPQILA